MIITFHKGVKWNLPQIPQYEGYTYSPMLCCPECEKKGWYNWMEETRLDIVGYAEVNGELQVCCECHHCGAKYRYHLSKHWNEDASFNVERWQNDVALQLFLNRETYRKFEMDESKTIEF